MRSNTKQLATFTSAVYPGHKWPGFRRFSDKKNRLVKPAGVNRQSLNLTIRSPSDLILLNHALHNLLTISHILEELRHRFLASG